MCLNSVENVLLSRFSRPTGLVPRTHETFNFALQIPNQHCTGDIFCMFNQKMKKNEINANGKEGSTLEPSMR